MESSPREEQTVSDAGPENRPTICTVIAQNYLAHARVLCHSFQQHHPTGRCFVLIVDQVRAGIERALENFTIVSLDEISLPEPRDVFCFKYNVTELCTAVKPFFLRWLIESRGAEVILYLDPDISVTGSLQPLFERLQSANVLLTPHLDTPYPDDGLRPENRHILISGIFNLGFLGLHSSPETLRLLKWLETKLTDHCVIAHGEGYFVDQRFFDLAYTTFAGIEIESDVGYNVAYWNIHSRTLSRDENGQWLCNGKPLRFFHFSDYRPANPDVISSHANRYRLSNRPDLAPLFGQYRAALQENDYDRVRLQPYGYHAFDDGTPIPDPLRAIYRSQDMSRRDKEPFGSTDLRQQSLQYLKWQRRLLALGSSDAFLVRLLRFIASKFMNRSLRLRETETVART